MLYDTGDRLHRLVDVRDSTQFSICSLSTATNVPLSKLTEYSLEEVYAELGANNATPIYVVCRRGIFSAQATDLLLKKGATNVFNIRGGLEAWRDEVDHSFPCY